MALSGRNSKKSKTTKRVPTRRQKKMRTAVTSLSSGHTTQSFTIKARFPLGRTHLNVGMWHPRPQSEGDWYQPITAKNFIIAGTHAMVCQLTALRDRLMAKDPKGHGSNKRGEDDLRERMMRAAYDHGMATGQWHRFHEQGGGMEEMLKYSNTPSGTGHRANKQMRDTNEFAGTGIPEDIGQGLKREIAKSKRKPNSGLLVFEKKTKRKLS